MNKKTVLFVYPGDFVGGSTTSLISLLNSFDYKKYDVYLYTYTTVDYNSFDIPKEVTIIKNKDTKKSKLYKGLKYLLKGYLFKAFYYELKYNKQIGLNKQVLAEALVSINKPLEQEFDVAIGYLEMWPNYFTINKTNANKKILWIHTDYQNANFITKIDNKYFSEANNIITVSKESSNTITNIFPQFKNKLKVIENIVSPTRIIELSNKKQNDMILEEKDFMITTVSRLDFYTKGIDRIISTVVELKSKKLKFKWYLIGDGNDKTKVIDLIKKHDISKELILLGELDNPFPVVKKSDVFVLPSRFEGKPISVQEAQILNVPCVVTNYSSSYTQVNDGIDGIIIDQDKNMLTITMEELILNPQKVKSFSKALEIKNKKEIENNSIQSLETLFLSGEEDDN